MPRELLPDRRQAETLDLWHGGRRYHLTIGQYDDGRPGEVFIHGAKLGSDTDLLCDDLAVLISRLLQHGDSPAALAAGIGRLGNGNPASIVGAIADVLAARPQTRLQMVRYSPRSGHWASVCLLSRVKRTEINGPQNVRL